MWHPVRILLMQVICVWVAIEEEEIVREALVNDSFDVVEECLRGSQITQGNAEFQKDSADEMPIVAEVLPPLADVAQFFEGVESLAERAGVNTACEGIRRAKRAFFEAYREQTRKRTRQTLISEHFEQ